MIGTASADLVAHWKLDEASGLTASDSAGANDATLKGNMTGDEWTDGIIGDAVGFEGILNYRRHIEGQMGDYVEIPPLNLNSNTVTMTCWAKRNGPTDPYWTGLFFTRNSNTAGGINFKANNDLGYHWDDAGNTWDWSSGLVTPGDRWFLAALVVEPTKATIYLGVDGVLTSATNNVAHRTQAFDTPTFIGTQSLDAFWADPFFKGTVDDCRIYNHSLTEAEIVALNVPDFIPIETFEDYNDFEPDRIFDAWLDCFSNDSGATVGHLHPTYVEQVIVHDDFQSMPFYYDNDGTTHEGTAFEQSGKQYYSEAERIFDTPQDWTRLGVKALTLYFYGDPANSVQPLYVAVQDSSGNTSIVNHPDPNAMLLESWQEWNIDLGEFSKDGVNLTSIARMYIGVGSRLAPQMGGAGRLFIDDIRLYRPRCLPVAVDLDGDCMVDYADLELMTGEWLGTATPEVELTADVDGDGDVDFTDFAEMAGYWLEEVLWPLP